MTPPLTLTLLCPLTSVTPQADPGLARCSFQSLSLCHVTNFTVFLGKDRAVAGSIQFPPDDGG